MVLLIALLGEEVAAQYHEYAEDIQRHLVGYFRPYLHPEDLATLEDAITADTPGTRESCRSIVERYGLRYDVNRNPHYWSVDTPWTGARKHTHGTP